MGMPCRGCCGPRLAVQAHYLSRYNTQPLAPSCNELSRLDLKRWHLYWKKIVTFGTRLQVIKKWAVGNHGLVRLDSAFQSKIKSKIESIFQFIAQSMFQSLGFVPTLHSHHLYSLCNQGNHSVVITTCLFLQCGSSLLQLLSAFIMTSSQMIWGLSV